MHYTLILALILTASTSFADLPSTDDLYKRSTELQPEATAKEPVKAATKNLKTLEKELTAAIKAYKLDNPTESTKEEDGISLLYFSLEPVFNLAKKSKITTEDCELTESELLAGDRKDDASGPSKNVAEALIWQKILCKEK